MGFISLFLIVANVLVSYKGLTDHSFYERYAFEVDKVLLNKEYKRLVTSGFLHISWMHLLFNLFSLYAFSSSVEAYLGPVPFLVVYFASLVGGNLFALYIHRNDGEFTAVGASGAVCGIIFASIALFPGMSIGFFLLPAIPAWLYGLLYVLVSIWGIRSKRDNVGHEAHLAGSLIGMLIAIAMQPSVLTYNYLPIIAVALPCLIFIYIIVSQPHILFIDNQFFRKQQRFHSIDHRYNAEKVDKQKEVDHILEKIHRKGINSLTKKEKDLLAEYSRTVK